MNTAAISTCLSAALVLLVASCSDDVPADEPLIVDTGAADADASESDSTADTADAIPRPVNQDDGSPCLDASECASNTCLSEYDGFPEGYCTAFDCEAREDCAGAGRACLRGEFNGNFCVELCGEDTDCRDGYECEGAATGIGG